MLGPQHLLLSRLFQRMASAAAGRQTGWIPQRLQAAALMKDLIEDLFDEHFKDNCSMNNC